VSRLSKPPRAAALDARPARVGVWGEIVARFRRSKPAPSDATEALARVRAGLSDGTLIEKRKAGIAFSKVAESWLKLHSEPSLRSHSLNQHNYDAHVKPYFKDTPLVAVTPERVLRFRAHLQGKTRAAGKDDKGKAQRVPLSPATVNVVLALVRSILKYAVTNGHLMASPTDRIGRGKLMLPVEKPKPAPPVEKPSDVGRLLAAIRDSGALDSSPLSSDAAGIRRNRLILKTGTRRFT
jgi:hypothetical protein